jgi:dTDP-4-amino-4,6-dideoxygalactose transaminase
MHAAADSSAIPFLSLRPGEDAPVVDRAVRRVIDRGWFILGPELDAFEQELARACGTAASAGVGTGTDALALILRALGIGPGDEVITAPLSAAYTALAIMMVGARPVFADIDANRLTIDPDAVAAAITSRTAAIMPVHLYGQPADMARLVPLAARHNLAIVEDACQAHLATCDGRPVGTLGAAGALSFYPTKNLGALGDGGAVITDDGALADRIKRLRNGGQSARYHHDEFGINSRLDEMQAAILRERLALLPAWTATRRALGARYREVLPNAMLGEVGPGEVGLGEVGLPASIPGAPTAASSPIVVPPLYDAGHVYHLFPVRSASREALRAHLAAQGIETLIHFPVPIPRQPALASEEPAECPVADRVCAEIFSLPLYPSLPDGAVDRVAAAIRAFRA